MLINNSMVPLIYDNGFDKSNIIGRHDTKIKQIIINQLKPNDVFIDTTWLKLEKDFEVFLNKIEGQSKRVICYSGPDWNNTYAPPNEENRYLPAWDELNKYDLLHVGNTRGTHFFSFWLDFVNSHLDNYEQFDPYDLQLPLKHFMCLNRKPHRPRVQLYNDLSKFEYLKYGHCSLGTRKHLPLDITNAEGDDAVSGDIEITNDINSLGHKDNWNSHFLNVVTETTVYTDVFITEKTFKPIIGRRPFIILGDKNIYTLLQDWGFDTFDDLFGTGYLDPDYEKRIGWILSIIGNLLKENNLESFLFSLKPRLEHNYQTLLKVAETNRNNLLHLLDK